MEVRMFRSLPREWATKKPLEKYDTQFLYIGFSRYDTTKKTLSNLQRQENGTILYTETPKPLACLARCYTTEHAEISVYSLNPRVWAEDIGLGERHVFVQQQATQTS